MALIKHAQSDALVRDAIVLDLAQLGRQAEELIAHAKSRAGAVVEDAQRERRRLLSDAREVGRAEGFAEGMVKGLEEGRAKGVEEAREAHGATLTELARAWTDALDRFERERDDMLLKARTDVLALALAMGRRVTGRIVETDPGVVAEQIERILRLVANPTRLTLRVHPEDLQRANEELPALCARFTQATQAQLVPDETVSRGSCVARSDRGEIDASIETQLERIIDALLPAPPGIVPPERAPEPSADHAPSPAPEPGTEAPSPDPASPETEPGQ